jgi:hypothetical protein
MPWHPWEAPPETAGSANSTAVKKAPTRKHRQEGADIAGGGKTAHCRPGSWWIGAPERIGRIAGHTLDTRFPPGNQRHKPTALTDAGPKPTGKPDFSAFIWSVPSSSAAKTCRPTSRHSPRRCATSSKPRHPMAESERSRPRLS